MENAVIVGLQTALPRSPGLRRVLEHVQDVMDQMNQNPLYIPLCYHCDRRTRRDPCEHCGISNPIGTKEQAAAAEARRAGGRKAIQLTKQPDGSYK